MKNRVGLGTFPLATVLAKKSHGALKDIVRQFINGGGFYIDTAPLYGFGEVENLLREVICEFERDKFFIASKCGYIDVVGKSFRTVKKSGKYEDVICECDRSLKRLGLDYLDLYFVHRPNHSTPFGETMAALSKLQEEGKIKEIGVSNVSLSELAQYNRTGKVKYVQNRFSLLNRSVDRDFQEYLTLNKIGLVPYHVIDRGLLTDKVFRGTHNFERGDLPVGRWDSYRLELIGKWIKKRLSPIAKRLDITIGQLAIAWALNQKFVSFVLVGVSNPKYLSDNLRANEVKLTPDVLSEIDSLYAELGLITSV